MIHAAEADIHKLGQFNRALSVVLVKSTQRFQTAAVDSAGSPKAAQTRQPSSLKRFHETSGHRRLMARLPLLQQANFLEETRIYR